MIYNIRRFSSEEERDSNNNNGKALMAAGAAGTAAGLGAVGYTVYNHSRKYNDAFENFLKEKGIDPNKERVFKIDGKDVKSKVLTRKTGLGGLYEYTSYCPGAASSNKHNTKASEAFTEWMKSDVSKNLKQTGQRNLALGSIGAAAGLGVAGYGLYKHLKSKRKE